MRSAFLMFSCAAVLVAGCSKAPEPTPVATTPKPAVEKNVDVDEHSYAEPQKVAIDDLALDIAVDFETKTIGGTATYALDWKDKAATQLVLDTRDLTIEKVEGEANGNWSPLPFALAAKDPVLGSKLTIETPKRRQLIAHDGEKTALESPFRLKVRHDGLKVLLPRDGVSKTEQPKG